MKKIATLALAAVALCGASSVSAQEVTYVEDCSQGLLYNRNADNWFITAQGGANVLLGTHDSHADFKNRIGANAAIYVGKWVSPVFGFRFGANWAMPKGATTYDGFFRKGIVNPGFPNGETGSAKGPYYPEKFQGLGPEFDVLINLTNWWCGYKPNRVYNAVVHGGAGAYWTWFRGYKHSNALLWHRAHNTILIANVGLQNNFRVSKHLDIFIDLQAELIDRPDANGLLSVNAGLTYNFGKTDFNCPVTAVCPTWKYTDAEGDALVARLASADAKIKDLQRQLDDCLKRPTAAPQVVNCEGLATIYYPINVYTITKREKLILKSVAALMKENPSKKYILTGWADNYTGNDQINTRLRHQRVNGVKKYLIQCGVSESQLDARIDANNLTDFGIKGAALDRAVTIKEAE